MIPPEKGRAPVAGGAQGTGPGSIIAQTGCSDDELAEAHALHTGYVGHLGLRCDSCGDPITDAASADVEWGDDIPAGIACLNCADTDPERDLGGHLDRFLGDEGLAALKDKLYPMLAALIPRLHPAPPATRRAA